MKKPSNRLAYSVGDYVKPKTRENVSAEIKLECFSLTVLDSLSGMVSILVNKASVIRFFFLCLLWLFISFLGLQMTPLFDTTITNINLTTHGRLESMNAVLISSVAASTFNPQLEAWEPLLEPFDGIFK